MNQYLILRLAGPMQSWGQPTFEGTRPTATFPTRSGLLGLLGACLGIRRDDKAKLQSLADSVRFAVRCDRVMLDNYPVKTIKLTDFHTIKDAREDYVGLKSLETILTWREYLCDASFTVAVWGVPQTSIELKTIIDAVQRPYFTPYLGRRCCPLTSPLFLASFQANNPLEALEQNDDIKGVIYSEEALNQDNQIFNVRDEPIISLPRQFASRNWYVIRGEQECI